MSDNMWAGFIWGGGMLFLAPVALTGFGHRARRLTTGDVKSAMTDPDAGGKVTRGPVLLGLGLAGIWVAVWALVVAL